MELEVYHRASSSHAASFPETGSSHNSDTQLYPKNASVFAVQSDNQRDQASFDIVGWPIGSRKLSRLDIGSLLLNLLGVSTAVLYLVLIAIVIKRNGNPVDKADWNRIQTAMNLAATLFPLAFAAVIGRMNQQLATWKLERGVSVGVLEQLFGSSTFFNTVITQVSVRSIKLLAFILIILWCISPLGSQSILRMLHTKPTTITRPIDITYGNDTELSTHTFIPSTTFTKAEAMYQESLLSPDVVKHSPLDIFRRLKIPLVNLRDSSDWIELDTENTDYSSLTGIVIDGVKDVNGETEFTMEAPYYNLHMSSVEGEPTFNSKGFDFEDDGMYTIDKSQTRYGLTEVYFNFTIPDTNFKASFNLTEQYVDMRVKCIDGIANCATTAIRPISRTSPHANGTYWADMRAIHTLFSYLRSAGSERSLTEAYFRNPDTPLAADIYTGSTFTIPVDIFLLRLTQVVNTYALLLSASSGGEVYNGTGTFTDSSPPPVYEISWPWLAISIVATSTIIVGAFVPALLGFFTRNPDILGYVSTMTRDAPNLKIPPGGVSRIGIGTLDQASLSNEGRLYE
ncbi:hypothetical protein AO1008_05060 [Aspergillus oryzae 100-8]|uniref:Uncharacterized protein n=1 Tax=Aspergillus oryzae (strain 3.042) TaxID=1160506 RepID=I8IM31_ASPO3|nr:hypothetical protein Ao3042_03336 [Aspergillus oryzae 3.042]KDE78873.1 hypothetical protein AO1008_05060 [Aspergillus oryzae 100-8]|eukprot:EIT80171.1 hypothetical protein Ao3042_03336 [Aspergillus oryzae 3.042]